MPTVARTWVFTADLEGLADVGDSANIPVNWDSVPKMLEFGPAAGGANDTERARGPVTSGKDWTVLFPGLPAGATVTSVQCTAWNYQRFAVASLTAWRFRVRIVDSAGASVHSAGELIDFTDNAPATDGVKQAGTAPGTSRAVDAGNQAAATIVALELQYNRTGGAANNDIDFDDIAITVTYTTASGVVVDRITTLLTAMDTRHASRRAAAMHLEPSTTKVGPTGLVSGFERHLGPYPPGVIKDALVVPTRVRVVSVTNRLTYPRRFPLQGWQGRVVFRSTSGTDEYDALQRGMVARLLGPRPAAVLIAVPSQRQQTIMVQRVAQARRAYSLREPHALLFPPVVVGPRPPPVQQQQTVGVTCVAVRTRVEAARHTPHARLSEPASLQSPPTSDATTVRVTLALRPRVELSRRAPHLRVFPPTVLQVFPGPQTTLVAVRTRLETQRHAPHQRLSPPSALAPVKVAPTVLTAAAARLSLLRRGTRSYLAPPTVVSTPTPAPPVSVTLAAVRGIAAFQRRAPDTTLQPPVVVAPQALPLPEQRQLRVVLGGRTRAEAQRRAPASFLSPPVAAAVAPFAPLGITCVAVRTRVDAVRRAPHARLFAPTVVQAPTPTLAPPVSVTLARDTAAFQRRAPASFLSPPAAAQTVAPFAPVTVDLARVRVDRRPPKSELRPPAAVLPLPSLRAQTVAVTLAAVSTRTGLRRREPLVAYSTTNLRPPPLKAGTTEVTLAVLATRASVRRRGPRTFYLATNLRPPPLKAGTTKVVLAAIKTRAELVRHTLSFLRPPAVVEPEPPAPPDTGAGVGGGGLPPEGQRAHQILDRAAQAVETNEDEEIAMLIALDVI